MALPGLARRPATLPAAATAPPAPSPAHTTAHAPGLASRRPPPSGREPGAGGAARPDSGRSRDRCRALAPRAARAEGSPGAQCLPGIGVGILAGVEAGRRRGSQAAGIPPLPKNQRRSGGDRALPPPALHRVKWRGGSEVVIHPHRDVQLGSSSHASPARVALPRREARGSSLPPCQYSPLRNPRSPNPTRQRGTRDSPRPRGHRGGNPPTPSRCASGSLPHAPFLSSPSPGPGRARSRSRPQGTEPPPGSAAAPGGDSALGRQGDGRQWWGQPCGRQGGGRDQGAPPW